MVTTKAKLSTTAKGLGHRHRVAVERLRDALSDGSACPWCRKPRWLERRRNWDFDEESTNPASGVLQGDHSGMSRSEALRRGVPIALPDRLLHGECNRQRGDGRADWMAPAATGAVVSATQALVMPWPW